MLLMDESCGRAFAETWGIRVHGTLYVILKALRRKLINKAEVQEALYALVERGFRIEPSLITWVLREIQSY